MEILIISGLSGGGKSKAASFLEDIGYYIVDNLPAEMMVKFADFCAASSGRYDRVALVYDVRAGSWKLPVFHGDTSLTPTSTRIPSIPVLSRPSSSSVSVPWYLPSSR